MVVIIHVCPTSNVFLELFSNVISFSSSAAVLGWTHKFRKISRWGLQDGTAAKTIIATRGYELMVNELVWLQQIRVEQKQAEF